jgi:hypothetical protein
MLAKDVKIEKKKIFNKEIEIYNLREERGNF